MQKKYSKKYFKTFLRKKIVKINLKKMKISNILQLQAGKNIRKRH